MNTTDQNDQNIFEDMKKCVRKAGLPVFSMPCACGAHPYGFSSRIGSGQDGANVWAEYDAPFQYATFRITFAEKLQAQDTGAMQNLLNELNSRLVTYHYFICPDCGGVELKAALYVPKKGFPKEKCSRLLEDLLYEIKDTYPAMIRVTKDNGTFEDLRRILRGDEKTSDEIVPASMSTTKKGDN
jgi:hypothetical protein